MVAKIEEFYDVDYDRIVGEIKKAKAKNVLLQFPDGLKPYATQVVDELEKRIKNINFIIWLGSCFGACDVPIEAENLKDPKIDLTIQIGHNNLMPSY